MLWHALALAHARLEVGCAAPAATWAAQHAHAGTHPQEANNAEADAEEERGEAQQAVTQLEAGGPCLDAQAPLCRAWAFQRELCSAAAAGMWGCKGHAGPVCPQAPGGAP